jgi:putative ABC transport system permease protein
MATAALMVALALALAIQITVGSFRDTFIVWLKQTVQADIYLQPVQDGDRRAYFTPARMAELRAVPGVQDTAELKMRRVLLGGREVTVLGVDAPVYLRRGSLPLAGAAPETMAQALAGDAVLVSETLARPLGLSGGDVLHLPTPGGMVPLPIAAVVQNYGQPAGVIYLGKPHFTRLFGPVPTERAALWVAPGADTAQVQAAVERLPVAAYWHVQPSATLRGEALAIFDRTFLITDLLGALAAVIAFIAVVSALTALLEERTRLLGYMRAIGLSKRRLGWALALEAMLIALVAGVLSWGTGLLMSVVLVYVLNPRAFGWTLQFHPGHGAYGPLLLMAVVAALLGSLYPITRATGLAVAATIREE